MVRYNIGTTEEVIVKHSYSASLSRSQGRLGYSIIFRHPVRRDATTGRPGIRVRRGLGTRDKAEAEQLRDELNQLLSDPKYRTPEARAEAKRRFDPRVVEIYFDKMTPKKYDFRALRDSVIPLPAREGDGYRHVLFLGTTGAGKTTLVRQLIGTHPSRERFPSTSATRATIHDTEIILDDGPWRAVVTFVSRNDAREHLNECIVEAVGAVIRGDDDATVLRYLLNHVDQRFRLSYVLGKGPETTSSFADFDDEDEEPEEDGSLSPDEKDGVIDLAATNEVLARSVARLCDLANHLGGRRDRLRTELLDEDADEEDKRAFEELFEEELDSLLPDDAILLDIAEALMAEIEKRFDLLPPGTVTKTRTGWPLTWRGDWPVEKRSDFISSVSRFSSNYPPLYGRLLTPLVNGVRVAGPFCPKWKDVPTPKLVLFDVEGLGHTASTSSSVSTGISRIIKASDAVLLVDNAAQPMQAAAIAAMRELITTGNGRKLVLVFTHFDAVQGDNLPNDKAKAQLVVSAVENALSAIGEDLGPAAKRVLRTRLREARIFLADLQKPLSGLSTRTIRQLGTLLTAIDQVIGRPQLAVARPVYDRRRLTRAIRDAANAFHGRWRGLLGLESRPEFPTKEHWARVKALNRRLAILDEDEYGWLKPVADLRKELQQRIYRLIQHPLRWEGPEASEQEKQSKYDALTESLGDRLVELSTRRVKSDQIMVWQRAYWKRGTGSTFVRARMIGNDIYEAAAPVPGVTPLPDRNQFLREVVAEVEAAAEEVDARFL